MDSDKDAYACGVGAENPKSLRIKRIIVVKLPIETRLRALDDKLSDKGFIVHVRRP